MPRKPTPTKTKSKAKSKSPEFPIFETLYIRLDSGEELISIVDKLLDDKKVKGMIDLHYPLRIAYMPLATQKGVPALVLTPWISTTISSAQVFRISMEKVTTLARPEIALESYYNSVTQRLILSVALRQSTESGVEFDPQSELGKKLKEVKEDMTREKEDFEDDQIAEALEKARRPNDSDTNEPLPTTLTKKPTVH
jgi:hypothetical protein